MGKKGGEGAAAAAAITRQRCHILPFDAPPAFPHRSSAAGRFFCLPHSSNSPSFPATVTPITQVQAVGASGLLDLYNNYGATSLLRNCSSLTQSPAPPLPPLPPSPSPPPSPPPLPPNPSPPPLPPPPPSPPPSPPPVPPPPSPPTSSIFARGLGGRGSLDCLNGQSKPCRAVLRAHACMCSAHACSLPPGSAAFVFLPAPVTYIHTRDMCTEFLFNQSTRIYDQQKVNRGCRLVSAFTVLQPTPLPCLTPGLRLLGGHQPQYRASNQRPARTLPNGRLHVSNRWAGGLQTAAICRMVGLGRHPGQAADSVLHFIPPCMR